MINTLPNTLRAEIFARIPDTGLRLVCQLWKQTFDSLDFKTIMGGLYDKWMRTAIFWKSIQLKWKGIFGHPLHVDSDLSGKLSWTQRMEKIAKFLYLQNPAMVAFCRANLNRTQATPLLQEMEKQIQEAADRKEASLAARARLKDECVSTVFSAKDDALIKMLPNPKMKEVGIEGNLSLEKLELISQAQIIEIKRIEWYANNRLKL